MGFLSAVDMAAHAPLDAALSWHLSSNHYPPVPSFFIETCKAAIEAAQEDDWDRDIPLPRGCVTHDTMLPMSWTQSVCPGTGEVGKGPCEITNIVEWKDGRDVVRAGDLVESMHLDAFLVEVDEED